MYKAGGTLGFADITLSDAETGWEVRPLLIGMGSVLHSHPVTHATTTTTTATTRPDGARAARQVPANGPRVGPGHAPLDLPPGPLLRAAGLRPRRIHLALAPGGGWCWWGKRKRGRAWAHGDDERAPAAPPRCSSCPGGGHADAEQRRHHPPRRAAGPGRVRAHRGRRGRCPGAGLGPARPRLPMLKATARVRVAGRLCNNFGTLHGGAVSILAERMAARVWATARRMAGWESDGEGGDDEAQGEGMWPHARTLSIDYMSPAPKGCEVTLEAWAAPLGPSPSPSLWPAPSPPRQSRQRPTRPCQVSQSGR